MQGPSTPRLAGRYIVDCVRCGQFEIGDIAINFVKERFSKPIEVANISGYLRQNPGHLIREPDLERLRHLPAPTPDEKAATLLIALGRHNPQPGAQIAIDTQRLSTDLHLTENVRSGGGQYLNDSFPDVSRETSKWLGFASAASPDELRYFASDYLVDQGLLVEKRAGYFVITSQGWQRIGELKSAQIKSSQAFVAMSFAPELKYVFDDAISLGIKAAGYNALRIDNKEHNNNIDDEIIAAIRQTKFVVADFTGNRAGVYYEAGFAKGLGREVIRTVREDELKKVHFDVRQANFIPWRKDDLPAFAKALQHRIEASIGKGPINNLR